MFKKSWDKSIRHGKMPSSFLAICRKLSQINSGINTGGKPKIYKKKSNSAEQGLTNIELCIRKGYTKSVKTEKGMCDSEKMSKTSKSRIEVWTTILLNGEATKKKSPKNIGGRIKAQTECTWRLRVSRRNLNSWYVSIDWKYRGKTRALGDKKWSIKLYNW